MIRLTHYQLANAYMAATDILDALADKDSMGSTETFIAEVVTGIDPAKGAQGRMCVTVDRASVLAQINERRESAIARLAALGIELDPGT